MWVEKRNDKFLMVDRYKDYMTGTVHRVSVIMDRDTPQARSKAKQILQAKIAAAREPSIESVSVSLEALKDSYIAYQRKILKDSTVHRNNCILNIVIRIIGSDILCDRLTSGIIMKKLLDTGKENVTINTYLTRLKAMLRWGYQNDMCPDLASKLHQLPDKSEREKIADKFLEKKELKILLSAMTEKHWNNLTKFLALSGLRIGEAIALEYDDLDIKSRVIHVTKTFAPVTRTVTSPKTTDSIRDVYMQNELLSLCRKLLTTAKRKSLEFGYTSNLVFADHEGKHITYDVYEKYLRERSDYALGRSISSHVMRHTMTSLFAEAGVPLDVIARRLGHHDSKLTRDIYLHCTQAQREKDNAAVKQVSLLG